METDYLKITATIALAVAGWIVGHYFTNKRSISAKRKDLVSEFLVNTYRSLANEVSHRDYGVERNVKIESLLSDIQLFGSVHQINLARAMADEVASEASFDLDPLINDLRDSLRKELGLKTVTGNIQWLRFEPNKSTD